MSPATLARAPERDRARLAAWLRRVGTVIPDTDALSLARGCALDRLDGPALDLTHREAGWPQWDDFGKGVSP